MGRGQADDEGLMVHAFYGVRTGFIRRGGVSFFAWLGQLASVVVSFRERCILDDWGAECRLIAGRGKGTPNRHRGAKENPEVPRDGKPPEQG